MSNQDDINFNLLERIVSRDLNNLQSLDARTRANVLRFMFFENLPSTTRNCVLGGLEVTIAAPDQLTVGPGALMILSSILPPVPTVWDSPYRLGFSGGDTVTLSPVPGGDTWYLLEARIVRNSLSEARDIKNVGTGLYVPTNVIKLYEFGLEYQLVQGTSSQVPAATGGDWVPLSAVFYDAPTLGFDTTLNVARRWSQSVHPVTSVKGEFQVEAHLSGAVLTQARWRVLTPAYNVAEGLYLGSEGGPADVSSASIKPASVVLAASTWYYLYSAAPQGMARTHPNNGAGVTVLSDVAPQLLSNGLHANSAFLTLPAPWDVAQVGVGRAVCMGALRRNAANNGWARQSYMGGGFYLLGDEAEYVALGTLVTSTGGSDFLNVALTTPSLFPASALTARLRINYPQGGNPGDYGYVIGIRPTGGAGVVYAEVAGTIPQGVIYREDVYIDVPLSVTGTSFSVQVLNIGNTNADATVSLVGFTW